ncbi:MAG: hypothetical protein K5768_06315 [Firmicutes bacterium]|nr:hypothetical protein [Bacillota bacterium]
MENLVCCSNKIIGMTATLVNGYSDGLFYLLYRIVPNLMQVDNKMYDEPGDFNREYGVMETVYKVEEQEEKSSYNANSRAAKRLVREQLKPGVSPLVYSRFLIDCAVFLSLNDMGKHLPEYEEIPVEVELKPEVKKEYENILKSYRDNVKPMMKNGRKLMSKYLSLLTTYSDQPYNAEPILEPGTDNPLIVPKDLSSIEEYNEKDIMTLDIVRKKVNSGGKVLIYTSWVKIDTQEKLKMFLEKEGFNVAVLEQKVTPDKREAWVEKQLEKGIDVLITNPSLVETGLDLNAFTTLIFYNVGYNLFTFRQASRRSWRINQTAPRVEVYILYFEGTMQARAIKLMASKLAAATLVEGSFSDEGLAAMSDCNDMTSQLARELTTGIRNEVEDIGAIFKKMAFLKDETADTSSDMSEYIIEETDEKEQVKECIVISKSMAEKIKRARELADILLGVKRMETAPMQPDIYEESGQLALFDLAS